MSFLKTIKDPSPGPALQNAKDNFSECIQACHDCLKACEHCATSCLAEPDLASMTRCIALDRSCADLCAIAAREMLRHSPFVEEVCRVCANACYACADECSRHQMKHCQDCAAACRHCAETCRRISEAVAHRES
jgi:hypothetical protein